MTRNQNEELTIDCVCIFKSIEYMILNIFMRNDIHKKDQYRKSDESFSNWAIWRISYAYIHLSRALLDAKKQRLCRQLSSSPVSSSSSGSDQVQSSTAVGDQSWPPPPPCLESPALEVSTFVAVFSNELHKLFDTRMSIFHMMNQHHHQDMSIILRRYYHV